MRTEKNSREGVVPYPADVEEICHEKVVPLSDAFRAGLSTWFVVIIGGVGPMEDTVTDQTLALAWPQISDRGVIAAGTGTVLVK